MTTITAGDLIQYRPSRNNGIPAIVFHYLTICSSIKVTKVHEETSTTVLLSLENGNASWTLLKSGITIIHKDTLFSRWL